MGTERELRQAKMVMESLCSGCSAFAWETMDGRHLWGRNFDFNRLAEGSKVTYIPREMKFYTCGTELEGTLEEDTCQVTDYAAVGTGVQIFPSTPVLYEGINERGLMGGQLYYREFAHFGEGQETGRLRLQPPFAVTYFLAKCATVEEVAEKIEREVQLVGNPLLGTVPPIHWIFSDGTGETIVVEPDRDGLHVYRNTMGVMTNSPSYQWHRLNLLNYAQIRDLDYEGFQINGEQLEQCFSGSGAFGMPGDWSSPSRFVRLSFLKKYGVKGSCEQEGISHMFRIFSSVAFPYGMVRVTENGVVTDYDKEVSPYDYTVYTSAMCAESRRFYWISYRNTRVQYVDLHTLLHLDRCVQFELGLEEDFQCVTDPDQGGEKV